MNIPDTSPMIEQTYGVQILKTSGVVLTPSNLNEDGKERAAAAYMKPRRSTVEIISCFFRVD